MPWDDRKRASWAAGVTRGQSNQRGIPRGAQAHSLIPSRLSRVTEVPLVPRLVHLPDQLQPAGATGGCRRSD